jgi:hypothetical protein
LSPRVPQWLERVTVRLQDVGGSIELLEDVVERVVMYARGRTRFERGAHPTRRRRRTHYIAICHSGTYPSHVGLI